ncbi:MAG: hypothetical protein J5785_06220 [Spirochaetales bacterium]|nr:hypothetical protein [Spirochaetales bacterium]
MRIRDQLDGKGNLDVRVLSIHFQIAELYRIANSKIIDLLALPYVYKEKSMIDILGLLKRGRIRAVFNFRHEQIGATYNEHRFYPQDDFTKNRIYHLAWSSEYKKMMVERGICENNIVIAQNPRSDLVLSAMNDISESRLSVAERYGLDEQKKWLLICESGEPRSEARINTLVNQGYSSDDLEKYNRFTARDIKEMENQLNSLPADFLSEYDVIYRPHPGTNAIISLNSEIKVIGSESIYFWLRYVESVLSRQSTVLFEAQAKGIKVFRFCPFPVPERFITYGLEKMPSISSIRDIAYVRDYANECRYEDYIGIVDGHAVERLSSALAKLAEDGEFFFSDYVPKHGLHYRKAALRSILSNIFSHIAYITGIHFLKKLSKPLTILGRDIPPEWKRGQ